MPNDQKQNKTNDSQQPITNIPPVIEDVLPPMPQTSQQSTVTSELPKEDIVNSGSGAPENDIKIDTVMPAVVTTGPKKKFAGGKVIATILGLFLLVGGVGAGVFLTGQNQNINEQAAGKCSDNKNQADCNSSCSPLKGDPQKSYECKWYSESSSCGESGQECGGGGNGGDLGTTKATCERDGGYWCDQVVENNGNPIPGFCTPPHKTCGSTAVDLGYDLSGTVFDPNRNYVKSGCEGGVDLNSGCVTANTAVASFSCPNQNLSDSLNGCSLNAGTSRCLSNSACGTQQIDFNYGGGACYLSKYRECADGGDTTPPTNPPTAQCITKPFVSGTVTAKADGKTTVKCTFSEKVDCIAPTVNGQGSPCTFTGWEGNTGVYDCNVEYSSVTTISCNTFPGSASNCCAGGNAVPVPLTPSAPPVTDTPPVISAVCQNIKAYNSAWEELTAVQLSALKSGNNIYFCVTGSASSGSFDKAKFTINGVVQSETTMKRPGGEDFCQNYTIPANTTTFGITAQINHVKLGWK